MRRKQLCSRSRKHLRSYCFVECLFRIIPAIELERSTCCEERCFFCTIGRFCTHQTLTKSLRDQAYTLSWICSWVECKTSINITDKYLSEYFSKSFTRQCFSISACFGREPSCKCSIGCCA